MAKVTFEPDSETPFISAIFLGLLLLFFGIFIIPIFFLGTALIVFDLFIFFVLMLSITIPIIFLRDILR